MLTKHQAWLLSAAHGAVDVLRNKIEGWTPDNWGPTDDIAAARTLMQAIEAVEAHEGRRARMLQEIPMTPESALLTAPTTDPSLTALRVLARTVIEVCDLLKFETYRDQPFTRDERALLLGAIEHAITHLEPLSHFLIYHQTEKGREPL
jgi:hypothetical protein